MYQKFVRFWFKFFQSQLACPTNSEGCILTTWDDIYDGECAWCYMEHLHKFEEDSKNINIIIGGCGNND